MNDGTPVDVHAVLYQAGELLDRRRTAMARAVLRPAIEAQPDHPELLFALARADYLDDDSASARRTLGDLLRLEPEHFGGRVLMLALLTDANELPEAEQVALSLLREYPQDADLYVAYARVMLAALHFAKARALVNEALRFEPDNAAALRARALCDVVELPRATDSAALSRIMAEHPEDQQTLNMMVIALAQEGRHAEALRGARELLRVQPDDPQRVNLVRALSLYGHWSMWPLLPLQRFGTAAVIGVWVGGIALVQVLARVAPTYATPISLLIFTYCVYSWVWPPLLKRWLQRQDAAT